MDTERITSLIGETATEADLKNVDCYIYKHLGLFIPSIGFCQYSIQAGHTHPSYMIVITFDEDSMKGLTNISLDKPLRKDHFLATILSPDIPHEEIADQFQHYYCIMIDKEYFESQYRMYASTIPKFQWKMFAVCHDVLKSLNQFAFEYEKRMPNAEITLDAQETILTHWMIRSVLGENYDMRGISADYGVARVQHFMEQHYGEKLSLEQLAEVASVSVSALNRGFRKELGITPMEYLTQVRIEKAKKMLRRQEHMVTEIALSCGFGSSAHFADIFGKMYQMTPSQYRKNYKND